MPARDVIVIGASAGGLQALMELVKGFPPDLPAAVFVVMHMTPYHSSTLPQILARSGPLPAVHAEHGLPIVPGRIYVAPPDHHLLVREGVMELTRRARENRTRPAVDPLFRTAARAYGPRVAGVILSGTQGDGTVGMMVIKGYGGVTLVQDPEEVLYSGMVRRAIEYAEVDHVLPVREISSRLATLARKEKDPEEDSAMTTPYEDSEAVIDRDFSDQIEGRRAGETAMYSCPDCGGVLWQVDVAKAVQFRCHVGHTYSPELLLVQKSETLEAALWAAVRTLVEKSTLTRQLAARLEADGDPARAAEVSRQAEQDQEYIAIIRDTILGANPGPMAQAYRVADAVAEPAATPAEEDDSAG
jgi:two-component system, chemotaxis family, protein-glutamate methylesterase/glutaminase